MHVICLKCYNDHAANSINSMSHKPVYSGGPLPPESLLSCDTTLGGAVDESSDLPELGRSDGAPAAACCRLGSGTLLPLCF